MNESVEPQPHEVTTPGRIGAVLERGACVQDDAVVKELHVAGTQVCGGIHVSFTREQVKDLPPARIESLI